MVECRTFNEQQVSAALRAMTDRIMAYQLRDTRVLDVMRKVPRHIFMPASADADFSECYADHPVPIGYGQTLSQPFIVAYMTTLLNVRPGEKILEIGAGSGYQSAILAELGAVVYSIEAVPELAEHARTILKKQGYSNVHILAGDGYQGWVEHSPYDAVIGTCAPGEIPQALINQLGDGGRMVFPVGESEQKLVVLTKKSGKTTIREDIAVRFVPMLRNSR